MTKAELIEKILRSRDLPPDLSKKAVALIVDLAFEELTAYFQKAKVTRSASPRFTFPGFGTFTKKRRSARRGVNPRTLEPLEIEACCTIDFKPASSLKAAMNPPTATTGSTRRGAAVAGEHTVERGSVGDVAGRGTPTAANGGDSASSVAGNAAASGATSSGPSVGSNHRDSAHKLPASRLHRVAPVAAAAGRRTPAQAAKTPGAAAVAESRTARPVEKGLPVTLRSTSKARAPGRKLRA